MMHESPPRKLVELLERLGLAREAEVRQVSRRVHRLARELPLFESVWVDALAQARVITGYQAQQLNAGRGESLGVGPYVIDEPLGWPAYASAYRAHERFASESVCLVVVDRSAAPRADLLGPMEALAAKWRNVEIEGVTRAIAVGGEGSLRWIASPAPKGRTAAEWLVHQGRFTADVVLEIARQMVASLAAMEKLGLCHGDLSTQAMVLSADGRVVLMQPGLRAIVRPEEGYADADLAPEAYDYLAPERVVDGTPPTIASDIFSCGCVWWHLLTGRPPLPGGNSLAKLRAAQLARIIDIRRLAPETPAELAAAVTACVSPEPRRRPESMARLAAMLGPSTQAGRAALARSMNRTGHPLAAWVQPSRRRVRSPSHGPAWLVAGTCVVAVLGLMFGSRGQEKPLASSEVAARGTGAGAVGERPSPPAPLPTNLRSVPNGRGEIARPNGSAGVAVSYEAVEPEVLVLPADKPVAADSLRLRAGVIVRGGQGQRARIMVPRTGLVVGVEDVRFENVDFVAERPDPEGTLVHLQAGRIEFLACRFERSAMGGGSAICWTHPVNRTNLSLSLPSGRVRLSDCVLCGVGVGIDCRTLGAIAIGVENVLCVNMGPMVRLDHFPEQEEPVAISLSQVTLRETGPLLECRYEGLPKSPGSLALRGQQCVFSLGRGVSLLLFAGSNSPSRLLENVQWTGQGSLLAPEAVVAGWQTGHGAIEALDDAGVAIAGLVRGEVGFADVSEVGVSASRATRWQVPLRSSDPPGVDVDRLPGAKIPSIRTGSI
jgi:serine/threonine-protein kinase